MHTASASLVGVRWHMTCISPASSTCQDLLLVSNASMQQSQPDFRAMRGRARWLPPLFMAYVAACFAAQLPRCRLPTPLAAQVLDQILSAKQSNIFDMLLCTYGESKTQELQWPATRQTEHDDRSAQALMWHIVAKRCRAAPPSWCTRAIRSRPHTLSTQHLADTHAQFRSESTARPSQQKRAWLTRISH